jgi:hypothetical protein
MQGELDDGKLDHLFSGSTSFSSKSTMAKDIEYKRSGGTKLRLIHPVESVSDFNFLQATGAIEVDLAPFGRFQTGITI